MTKQLGEDRDSALSAVPAYAPATALGSNVQTELKAVIAKAREGAGKPEKQSARTQLTARRYDQAYAVIRQAEQLDPSNLEIQSVTKTAREEVRLAFRRSRLSEIAALIVSARDEGPWRHAAASVHAMQEQLASDPLLLRYKLQIRPAAPGVAPVPCKYLCGLTFADFPRGARSQPASPPHRLIAPGQTSPA